jgi:hypothetical protein
MFGYVKLVFKKLYVLFKQLLGRQKRGVEIDFSPYDIAIDYLLMKHRIIRYFKLLFTTKVPSTYHLHKLTESFLEKLRTRQQQNLNRGD